jgi:hypothetical protein
MRPLTGPKAAWKICSLAREGLLHQPIAKVLCIVVATGLAVSSVGLLRPSGQPSAADSSGKGDAGPLRALHNGFIDNEGQADPRAAYYLEGTRGDAYFTRRGMRMVLADRRDAERRWNLGLEYVGARHPLRPMGRGEMDPVVSYFKGAPSEWSANVRVYSKLVYRDVWPGIDAVYSVGADGLKYSFVVRPEAEAGAIRLAWRGATGLEVTENGELEVSTPGARLGDAAPISHQVIDGRRVRVPTAYEIHGDSRYGFRVGRYDRHRPLVIDPAVLVYAGYIGGINSDQANNVAVDRRGSLYVTGTTESAADSFPDKVGPDRGFNGAPDAFVAKVDKSGRKLRYAGYIGGSGEDAGIGIAVDRDGYAYISGSTASDQSTFPVKRGPDLTYGGGPFDAFVAKVNPSGRSLNYAGYIGGSGESPPGAPNEQANGVSLDGSGNAYVAGFTASPEDSGFPATAGSFDSSFNGLVDGFVVKVNRSGDRFLYGGYIGGAFPDPGTGISTDRAGNAYVTGFTGSDETTFPDGDGFGSTPGFDRTYNGGPNPFPLPNDAYVARVNPPGSSLAYATYIGGSGVEQPFNNKADRNGSVYVTGNTTSAEASFPDGDGFGSIQGFDRSFNGGAEPTGGDAFLVKLQRSGTDVSYATYIGGTDDDRAIGIALEGRKAYVVGETASPQRSFPLKAGPDRSYNGGPFDAFVAGVKPSGKRLLLAGYIGGQGEDRGIGAAIDRDGRLYASGSTTSNQKSFPVRRGPDRSFNSPAGVPDAFVARVVTSR